MKTRTFTIILLSAAILCCTDRTSAQGLSLGMKAGIGLPYFSNFENDNSNFKRSPGFMASGGFIMNYKFGKVIGLQTELLFQQKGEAYKWNFTEEGMSWKFKGKIYINYLTLPVLLQASHSFGRFYLSGGLGPYVGYALNGKLVMTEPEKDETKLEFGKGNFRRFDAGVSFGLGCGYRIGPGNLYLDMRYDLGLLDVQYVTDKPDGYKSRCTRNAGIALAYLIPLGKK